MDVRELLERSVQLAERSREVVRDMEAMSRQANIVLKLSNAVVARRKALLRGDPNPMPLAKPKRP